MRPALTTDNRELLFHPQQPPASAFNHEIPTLGLQRNFSDRIRAPGMLDLYIRISVDATRIPGKKPKRLQLIIVVHYAATWLPQIAA